jgi:hypothetical protein
MEPARRSTMGAERERAGEFTDEQYEVLRHVRFGELPARVAPVDLVETVQRDASHEEPPEPPVRREWG